MFFIMNLDSLDYGTLAYMFSVRFQLAPDHYAPLSTCMLEIFVIHSRFAPTPRKGDYKISLHVSL